MILFYNFGYDEKAETIRRFLKDKGFAFRDIDQTLVHESLGTLLKGGGSPQDNPSAPEEVGICFSRDKDHEESVRLLAAFERIDAFFTYKIHEDETNTSLALQEVFQAQVDNERFIEALRQLQDLIEATSQLDQEDYDPDLWSDLKFAVADANDFFAALVSKELEASEASLMEEIDRCARGLRKALARLVG